MSLRNTSIIILENFSTTTKTQTTTSKQLNLHLRKLHTRCKKNSSQNKIIILEK